MLDSPRIISINISKGGIPKLPVHAIEVKESGLVGDGHNHAKHNTPIQAICLQDIERLQELSSNGYTLTPGKAGENLTVENLNVNALSIGTRLRCSRGVVLEITKIRKPCYVMDVIDQKLKEDSIGKHGMYAKVLVAGIIKVGDLIEVEKLSEK